MALTNDGFGKDSLWNWFILHTLSLRAVYIGSLRNEYSPRIRSLYSAYASGDAPNIAMSKSNR